jgi:SAM-dependent methyltransferase
MYLSEQDPYLLSAKEKIYLQRDLMLFEKDFLYSQYLLQFLWKQGIDVKGIQNELYEQKRWLEIMKKWQMEGRIAPESLPLKKEEDGAQPQGQQQDQEIKTWSEFYKRPMTRQFYVENISNHKDFLLSILKSNPKRVIEIGAGTASFSIFLKSLNLQHVSCLDNDRQVLEIAEKNAIEILGPSHGINFAHGDAFNLDKSQRYDVVFHQGLIEHFSPAEIEKLLSEQLAVADRIVLSVPTFNYGKQDVGNEVLLTSMQWRQVLQGFRYIKIDDDFSYWNNLAYCAVVVRGN